MTALPFQRARSAEQREARRRAILGTASVMLTEMRVSGLSLNELSRRVGLAKSNVLRYFDSREAVLLELLTAEWTAWREDLAGELASATSHDADVRDRCVRVAATVARSLERRPVLCDLLSAKAGVLEHNVSAEVAGRFKRAALKELGLLGELLRTMLPEMSDELARSAATSCLTAAGEIWTYANPADAMRAAYTADPELQAHAVHFTRDVADAVTTILAGCVYRSTWAADGPPDGA